VRDLFDHSPTPALDERRVLTVGELNAAIEDALRGAFPTAVWVRGEIQRLVNRNGNIYFELHGADGGGVDQLQVKALKWDRAKFGLDRYFDGSDPDLRLRDSMEACLQVRVDYHRKWGLSLQLVGVDTTYTLGQLEARRRRTLAWLQAEGLLELNKARPLADLPLRVGLVTSADSAAARDFLTGLRDSGYAFGVRLADCRMMGDAMVAQVAGAVTALGRADVDVVVVTRGGGARADLSWFDHPEVCAAIARCGRPVLTAIGHEIDQSLADLVAHHHLKTPTAAAQHLVDRVAEQEQRLERAAAAVGRAATDAVHRAGTDLSAAARRLGVAVGARVRGEAVLLAHLRAGVAREARRRLREVDRALAAAAPRLAGAARRRAAAARRDLDAQAARLAAPRVLAAWPRRREALDRAAARLARRLPRLLAERARRLAHLEEKARLLDPERLLARGYSLTLDAEGRLLRSAAAAPAGARIVTRLRDGRLTSIVERSEPRPKGADE